MRGLRTLIFAVTATVFCSVSPVTAQHSQTLFGLETENDALAWRAVGRLDAKEIGFCTATLISPEYVLTAAHCVFSSQTGKQIPPEDIVFRAGFRRGHAAAERSISQIEVHSGYNRSEGSSVNNIRHDVALLRIAQPISTAELDYFVVHDRKMVRGLVSLVSYGKDRETLPSRQDVCKVKGSYQGIMMFNCQATFGSSGAPVLREVSGTYQIVSIISGGGTIEGEWLSFGMVLPELVADLEHQMWMNKPKPVATLNRIQAGSGSFGSSSGGAKFVRP